MKWLQYKDRHVFVALSFLNKTPFFDLTHPSLKAGASEWGQRWNGHGGTLWTVPWHGSFLMARSYGSLILSSHLKKDAGMFLDFAGCWGWGGPIQYVPRRVNISETNLPWVTSSERCRLRMENCQTKAPMA